MMILHNIWQAMTGFAENPFGEGIIIGVFAGLITSALIGIFHWYRIKRERKHQMKYVALTIQKCHIAFSQVLDDMQRKEPSVPRDHSAGPVFNSLITVLNDVLTNNTHHMEFKKILNIKTAVGLEFYSDGSPHTRTESECHKIFRKLENMSWIKKALNE